jgi:hypothetical protein
MIPRTDPEVPQALLVLYRTMPTEHLQRLRRAFTLDLATAIDPSFCRLRLTIIARVLEERGVEKPQGVESDEV